MKTRFYCGILAVVILLISCSNKQELPAAYLEINLNDTVSANFLARGNSPLDIFKVIEKARSDEKIIGIILNIGSMYRSRDYLWELRSVLEQVKAEGKKIIAYINNADIDTYMLASVADKIVMDDLGLITVTGYASGAGFFSQSLEKLGVGVKELRYFEYKSAAESFTRTSMSDADRRQTEDYLDDIYNYTRSVLMEARGWSPEDFNTVLNGNFMHSAASAMAFNLVDYTGSFYAVKEAIDEIEDDLVLGYYLFGDSSTSITGSREWVWGQQKKYTVPRARGIFTIAVVNADGQTDMERGMNIGKISELIYELADNNNIKAIVVRMNSPGGSAQAAECLSEAIRYADNIKPVVVSMGQVAASGGYWASINASHIMATPYTITGSIGVISTWFYDNGLYDKLGLSLDIIKRGDHSDLMAGFLIPYRNLTEPEEEQYKKYILDLYEIFIEKVVEGRGMNPEEVENVAQGRIFSGSRALDAGLIDSIGGLSEALALARELAGINESAQVSYREYPEPTFLERLIYNFPVSANNSFDFLDMLFPDMDLNYRLDNNGQVMPLLPLNFCIF